MNRRPCKLPSDNVVLAKHFSDNKKTALLQNPMAEAHGRDWQKVRRLQLAATDNVIPTARGL